MDNFKVFEIKLVHQILFHLTKWIPDRLWFTYLPAKRRKPDPYQGTSHVLGPGRCDQVQILFAFSTNKQDSRGVSLWIFPQIHYLNVWHCAKFAIKVLIVLSLCKWCDPSWQKHYEFKMSTQTRVPLQPVPESVTVDHRVSIALLFTMFQISLFDWLSFRCVWQPTFQIFAERREVEHKDLFKSKNRRATHRKIQTYKDHWKRKLR